MSERRQILLGMLMALLSGSVMWGGAVLSLVESDYVGQKAATAAFIAAWEMPTFVAPSLEPGQPTFTAVARSIISSTPTPTFSAPASCQPPPGWVSVMLPLGGSLIALADQYGANAVELAQANCLPADTSNLPPGSFLFIPGASPTPSPIPATFTPTATTYICGAPASWVSYIVRAGDTLHSLSSATGVSVPELQKANCLGTSTTISPGDLVYLPFIPYPTPWPTKTPWPTRTPTYFYPSSTPITIPTFTPAPTNTRVPTNTIAPTNTSLPAPTQPTVTIIPAINTPTPVPPTQAPSETIPANTAPPPPSATPAPPPTATQPPMPTIIPEPINPSPTPVETVNVKIQ